MNVAFPIVAVVFLAALASPTAAAIYLAVKLNRRRAT